MNNSFNKQPRLKTAPNSLLTNTNQ